MDLSLECKKCSYHFSARSLPKRCPYCDKEGGIGLVQTAQDLLDETVGEFNSFEQHRKERSR